MRSYFGQGFEQGSDDYFYTRDHLGSVREVVGSDGATVGSRLSYDPWGKVTESGSASSDFTYTGHYYDRPTGLTLAWYRGYDPQQGRWLSEDPIGLHGGLNLYSYVENDPINAIDPLGQNLESFYDCLKSGIPRHLCFEDEARNWCEAFPAMCPAPPVDPGCFAPDRKPHQPDKPNRKKQGREPKEKKRSDPKKWKPRNPPKEPPRHTPSRKN